MVDVRPLQLLTYEYVENIVERRAAHREAHLVHANAWRQRGAIVMAGAVGDPPHGALFVFEVGDAAEIDAFVRDDPYVQAELVTAWRVEPWAVVVH